jgi:branched-chain amino acid transport system permease protein
MIAYLQNIAVLFCINAILALTLNFIMGYAGIFSLAHAIFFGVGAYATAYIAMHASDSLLLCMAASAAISAVLSMALALPALRVRGEYFVAASLGLQVIGVTIFSEWKSITGGLGGMIGIPRPKLWGYTFNDDTAFLALALVVLGIVVGITALLVRGSFGRSLMAIRDSESAAQTYGKHVNAIKTLSVAVAAGFTSFIDGTVGTIGTVFIASSSSSSDPNSEIVSTSGSGTIEFTVQTGVILWGVIRTAVRTRTAVPDAPSVGTLFWLSARKSSPESRWPAQGVKMESRVSRRGGRENHAGLLTSMPRTISRHILAQFSHCSFGIHAPSFHLRAGPGLGGSIPTK